MRIFDQDERHGSTLASEWESLPHLLQEAEVYRATEGVGRVDQSRPNRKRFRSADVAEIEAFPTDFGAVHPAYATLHKVCPGSRAAKRREKEPSKRAALLDARSIKMCEEWIAAKSRSPHSDLLKLRLSVNNGLRAGEIAALPLGRMLDARNRVSDRIEVYSSKTNSTRRITMNRLVAEALQEVLRQHPKAEYAAFSIASDGSFRRQSASCVTNWFARMYRGAGLTGCSSHSGRRTFATLLSRQLGGGRGSIVDLQRELGHARMSSTECYLEPTTAFEESVRNLGYLPTGQSSLPTPITPNPFKASDLRPPSQAAVQSSMSEREEHSPGRVSTDIWQLFDEQFPPGFSKPRR